MTRSALPQNYITQAGTTLETCADYASWTVSGGTGANDTTNYKLGTSGLKLLTAAGGGNSVAIKTVSYSLATISRLMGMWVYTDTPTGLTVTIYFSSNNFTAGRYIRKQWSNLRSGWNVLILPRSEIVFYADESLSNTMNRIQVRIDRAGSQGIATFGGVFYDRDTIPKCILGFDDARGNIYNNAYPIMAAKGMKGTIYVPSNLIGTGTGAGAYFTLAELQTVYDAGWALANHTNTHTDLSTLSTVAEIDAAVQGCTDYLLANGFDRAVYHGAYPVGGYNSTVLARVAALNMLTFRATTEGRVTTPNYAPYELKARFVGLSTSLATAQGYVDEAINTGATIMFYFHGIVESPSADSEWSIANFQALINYISARKLDVVTIDEWYKGLTNPRCRSLSLARTAV